MSFSLMLLIRS